MLRSRQCRAFSHEECQVLPTDTNAIFKPRSTGHARDSYSKTGTFPCRLTAQIARVEASARRALIHEDASLKGNGADRLLKAERLNQDLYEAKQRAERKLRQYEHHGKQRRQSYLFFSEKQRSTELKTMMEHSKKRTDRLLHEKHVLFRKVGQLECAKSHSAPPSPTRTRRTARAGSLPTERRERKEELRSLDKPFVQSCPNVSKPCSDACPSVNRRINLR